MNYKNLHLHKIEAEVQLCHALLITSLHFSTT